MIDWIVANGAWLCVVWLLAGALVVLAFVRAPRPEVKPWPAPPQAPPFESDADYYRRKYDEEVSRSIGRSLNLSMRIYELEEEKKHLAFRLRCAECLISVRALRGDLELDGMASEEGMGC